MKRSKKVLFGAIPVIAAIVMLIFSNTADSASQEVTIADVLAEPKRYEEKLLMLQGDLLADTVQWDADRTLLQFSMKEDGRIVKVKYKGVKPDTFTDGTIVMVDGTYDLKTETVLAERLRTRCPSKYESMDIEKNKEAYEKQHGKKE